MPFVLPEPGTCMHAYFKMLTKALRNTQKCWKKGKRVKAIFVALRQLPFILATFPLCYGLDCTLIFAHILNLLYRICENFCGGSLIPQITSV